MRDFEQDRKICDAASEGPWIYEEDGCDAPQWIVNDSDLLFGFEREPDKKNVDFVIAAREGWPAALDEVKRLSENINAYAFESGRVSLKCQDQSKEIESLKMQLQVAANMEACEGRCPETKECPTDRDCVDCWLEYWRQQSGTFQNGNNHGTTSKMETVGEGEK